MGVKFTNLSNYGAPLCNYVNLCHYVNISWCGDLFQCARYWTTGDQVFVLHAQYHPYVPEGHCRWDCWALADANLLPFASPAAQQSPSSGLAPKMVALKFASSSNGKEAANWKLCFLMWWFWWWFLNGEEHSIYRNSLLFRESGVQQEAAR